MSVQDYLISQETKALKQVAEFAITKALPTMLDVCKGMAAWLSGQQGGKKEGQQTLEQLTQYGDKLAEIPLNSESIKAFTHTARKHGVSFALEQDGNKTPPKHTVYFKAKDTEAMTAAFKEHLSNEIGKGKTKEKPFKEMLNVAKDKAKAHNQETTADKDKATKRGVDER